MHLLTSSALSGRLISKPKTAPSMKKQTFILDYKKDNKITLYQISILVVSNRGLRCRQLSGLITAWPLPWTSLYFTGSVIYYLTLLCGWIELTGKGWFWNRFIQNISEKAVRSIFRSMMIIQSSRIFGYSGTFDLNNSWLVVYLNECDMSEQITCKSQLNLYNFGIHWLKNNWQYWLRIRMKFFS